jgi:Winged helix DNA-binding domain
MKTEAYPADDRHPPSGLDDTVHQRVRLGILTIAHEARRVEFSYLRDNLELTAGNLSQHLGVLESAGLTADDPHGLDARAGIGRGLEAGASCFP